MDTQRETIYVRVSLCLFLTLLDVNQLIGNPSTKESLRKIARTSNWKLNKVTLGENFSIDGRGTTDLSIEVTSQRASCR